jgi:hypothetical protein
MSLGAKYIHHRNLLVIKWGQKWGYPLKGRPLAPAKSSPGICRTFHGLISGIPGAGPGLFIKFFQTYFFDFLVDQYPTFCWLGSGHANLLIFISEL